MKEHRLPVVIEIILERIANVAMGTEIENVTELTRETAHEQRRFHRPRNHGPTMAMHLITNGHKLFVYDVGRLPQPEG
jgi:hypothetical protein